MSQSFVIFKLLKRIVLFSYIKLTFTLFKCRLHISQLFGSIAYISSDKLFFSFLLNNFQTKL